MVTVNATGEHTATENAKNLSPLWLLRRTIGRYSAVGLAPGRIEGSP
jgi:hypothetical protein